MAHPKRKDLVNTLFLTLCKSSENVTIVWDRRNNEWDTGKRCLEMADETCDWTVIIQDDAVIGENFVKNVENYLRKAEKTLTSFYLGRGRPYYKEMLKVVAAAQENNCNLISIPHLYWGVCIALPSIDCKEIAKEENEKVYDAKIGNFYFKKGKQVIYTLPSLADHSHCQSLIFPDDIHRDAFWYCAEPITLNNKIYKY